MLDSAQTKEQEIYDPDAEQRFTFGIEGDDEKYVITQVYRGLPDEVLEEYDRLREVLLSAEGNKTDVNTDSMEADEYLFNELCTNVEGFEGDKPENWKELIPYDEKKAGINKLLAVKIVSSEKEKQVKKREWGKSVSSNTVEIKFYNNGKVASAKANFDRKTPGDIAAYAVIKSRLSLVDKDLDDSAIKIPAQMKKKAKLFDKMNPQVEGEKRTPLHHKAAFITGFFEPRISSTEKK